MLVPSQRTDVGQGGSVVEPRGRERMPEQRGPLAGRIEPGVPQRAGHDRRDRSTVGKATAWRPHPDNDLPRHTRRSVVTPRDGSGLTDLRGEGQAIMAGALPPHQEFARFPSQIIAGQGGHCTSP